MWNLRKKQTSAYNKKETYRYIENKLVVTSEERERVTGKISVEIRKNKLLSIK